MTDENAIRNAARFSGFADVYESVRPRMPLYPVGLILKYLGKAPELVADIGCGTGLSTLVWRGHCGQAVGIEPNDDMLHIAKKRQEGPIRFQKGFSHDTGLKPGSADVVTCVQALHWMEPFATFQEVDRILRPGGVFAAVDCDWPPLAHPDIDRLYMRLFDEIHRLEQTHPVLRTKQVRYPKERHLHNMIESGVFRFAREAAFSNAEPCDAQRLIGLTMSQGSLQNALKHDPGAVSAQLAEYKAAVQRVFGSRGFEVDFSYRMRIAVK